MIFISILLGIFIILFWITRKEELRISSIPIYMSPFYKIAYYVSYSKKIADHSKFSYEKIKKDLFLLTPTTDIDMVVQEFYLRKQATLIFIIFSGLLLAIMVDLGKENLIMEDNIIWRNQGNKEVELWVESSSMDIKEKIIFPLSEQRYTSEELEDIYIDFILELEKALLGENVDCYNIEKDLNFIKTIYGYPFEIEWITLGDHRINTAGEIQSENIGIYGESIKIAANISYYDFNKTHEFELFIMPIYYTEYELFIEKVKKELIENDDSLINEAYIQLPNSIANEKIIWKEIKNYDEITIFILFLISGIFLYIKKEDEIKEKLKKRERELLRMYPSIVSKLTLYLSAGMTIKGAWNNVLKNQPEDNVEGIYKEMKIAWYEMECGIAEVDVYERFGKRCGLQSYIKLTALLVQNIEKGNAILLQRLKEETQLAFIERKNKIKTKAEEASTKLLFPMLLNMVMIMIMIMIPAFHQFW